MFDLYRTTGLLLVLLSLTWIANSLRVRFRPGIRKIPGPRLAAYTRWWNVKNAASGDAHQSFRRLHEKYGKVVRVGPNHVAISDPAMIPVIYGTNNKFLKTRFYDLFVTPYEGNMMHSMFSTTEVSQHRTLRRSVANTFSLSSMKQFEPQVNECTDKFVSVLQEYAESNQVFDLGKWLQWYAFDVIGAITFNKTFGFMEERKDVQDIIAGIEIGLWYGCICGQVPEFHPWLLGNEPVMKVLSRNIAAIEAADPVAKVVKMVEAAMMEYDMQDTGASERTDFLALFRQERMKSPERMPRHELMNHLMNNLLAGSDTTGISLRAIFYYLIMNPRSFEKLVDEILLADREGRASKNITLAEATQMLYLQACIKEAMRLHPGVGFPLERHVPDEGLNIGDVFLPKGTVVGMNAWVIHHDKDVFGADADDFRPERWLEATKEEHMLMEKCFLSFGAGTRTCVGKNISMMEMSMMVPQLLRDFDLSWASDQPTWQINTFWFAKQSGVLVRIHPRAKRDM
ncbi:Pisatin demethylase [Lachnellula occidentalis]|uniref:Pisatin demethylase n=1 Tax=Lachnellula occidentalis TaxID=215460 RepID=A0A8H8RN45_9HELO|nr:Pisatin demethylase [Lachnellula occidentalis]